MLNPPSNRDGSICRGEQKPSSERGEFRTEKGGTSDKSESGHEGGRPNSERGEFRYKRRRGGKGESNGEGVVKETPPRLCEKKERQKFKPQTKPTNLLSCLRLKKTGGPGKIALKGEKTVTGNPTGGKSQDTASGERKKRTGVQMKDVDKEGSERKKRSIGTVGGNGRTAASLKIDNKREEKRSEGNRKFKAERYGQGSRGGKGKKKHSRSWGGVLNVGKKVGNS